MKLNYNGTIFTLEPNERFFCPDDKIIEIMYTGDEVEVIYGNNQTLMSNFTTEKVTFTFIEKDTLSIYRKSITYPIITGASIDIILVKDRE